MGNSKMFLSLIPWVAFTLIVQVFGAPAVAAAALAALVLAAGLLIANRRGGVKLIDVTGIVTFGALAAIAFFGGPAAQELVAHFGRGGSAVVLAAVMLISAVTVPFTEAYARESVPEEFWGSPTFRAVNRRISAVWGGVIALVAASHIGYGWLVTMSPNGSVPRPVNLVLNWAIPIGLVLFGMKFTKRAAGHDDAEGSTPQVAR